MVPFSTPLVCPLTWDLGPHFWNSGGFPHVTTALACCQRHDRQVRSTESDRLALLTFITVVCF